MKIYRVHRLHVVRPRICGWHPRWALRSKGSLRSAGPLSAFRESESFAGPRNSRDWPVSLHNTSATDEDVCAPPPHLGIPGRYADVEEGTKTSDSSRNLRKAFVRELEAMTRLRSPHTVNVYGAVTSRSDQLILVMELLPGGDLRSFLKKSSGPLPEHEARRIVEDICAGMAFLHSKSTIHGDLKSANVLLDGAGRAKVGARGRRAERGPKGCGSSR